MPGKLVRLAAIATAAGAFSGLFGVGGGTLIVPLLIVWLGYEEREATGTSLAAIVVIAALAAGAHGLYGNVESSTAYSSACPPWPGWWPVPRSSSAFPSVRSRGSSRFCCSSRPWS